KNILSTAHKSSPNSGIDENVQKELASSETEQIAFLASLIRSFRKLERSNQGVRNDATFRPNEAALNAADLLANMKPVGLFNRLDLAPASWRYCGEHRVVFARGTGTERIFLIFEAALDNPDPTHARAGCLRIARFWNSLRTMPEDQRPDALQNFY